MKKMLFLSLSIFVNMLCCFAKQGLQTDITKSVKILYIINYYDRPPIITANDFIDPSAKEYKHFLHGSQYDQLNKDLKVTLIEVEQLKLGTKTMTLIDVFNKYHIPEKYRHSKVEYDDEYIEYPATMVISSNQIAHAKIVKTNKGVSINIIGTDYNEIKKLRDAKKNGETFVD